MVRYCLILYRQKKGKRRALSWRKDEWKWIIFNAKDRSEAVEKAKRIANEGGWHIMFLGIELTAVVTDNEANTIQSNE